MSENPSGQGRDMYHWFVMTHLEVDELKANLDTEMMTRLGQGVEFRYFIPYLNIKRRVSQETLAETNPLSDYENPRNMESVRANNDLRQVLRRFVFIRTTSDVIDDVVKNAEWNVQARVRLHFYRDPLNEYATVPDSRMSAFIAACESQSTQFEVVPKVTEVRERDEVVIRSGSFRGQTARVLAIDKTSKGTFLRLGFELFAGRDMVLHRVPRSHVTALPGVPEGLATMLQAGVDPIEFAQVHLLEILGRKVGGYKQKGASEGSEASGQSGVSAVTAQQRADRAMLRRISGFSRLRVETPSARNHLLALLLICACLRKDMESRRSLTEACLSALDNLSRTRLSDVHAYLWVALFLATRQPDYRDQAKRYVRHYAPKSPRLQQFIRLIRK